MFSHFSNLDHPIWVKILLHNYNACADYDLGLFLLLELVCGLQTYVSQRHNRMVFSLILSPVYSTSHAHRYIILCSHSSNQCVLVLLNSMTPSENCLHV